jgi:host factor-I protein
MTQANDTDKLNMVHATQEVESRMTTQLNALQETVLQRFRKHLVPVTIYLVNGGRLQGIVTEVDSYSLLLTRGPESQVIYKSAISSMMPDQSDRGAGQESRRVLDS